MAVLKIIPQEHWAIIKEYTEDNNAIIFVPEDNLKELPKKYAKLIENANGEHIDYDFGDEADIWVDILQPGFYCADTVIDILKQNQNEQETHA